MLTSLHPFLRSLSLQANRFARVCFEDAFRYAHRRRTFGKALVEHPVIRWKLAEMARQIEATHAALEALTYQSRGVAWRGVAPWSALPVRGRASDLRLLMVTGLPR